MNVTGKVETLSIGDIFVRSTTFGKVDIVVVKTFLNMAFRVGIPLLNKFLESMHIMLPGTLMGIFELSDVNLNYFDHYILAGFTPKFIPIQKKPKNGTSHGNGTMEMIEVIDNKTMFL